MKFQLKYIVLLFTFVIVGLSSFAQGEKRGNLPNYYQERLNFGFIIGINRANFTIYPAPNFETFDSLKSIESDPKAGFNLGIVSELMLYKYLTLRFIPNLGFSGRNIAYSFEGVDTIVRNKTIESTFLNFPVNLKLRSKRIENFGAYLLAGGGYALDLVSKEKTVNSMILSEQIVKLKRDDIFYEFGAGAEFYFEYFKFAIEGKMSFGTQNLLIKDNTIFSNSIDKLNSKVFLLSITFEG